jgi:hypothetical protein
MGGSTPRVGADGPRGGDDDGGSAGDADDPPTAKARLLAPAFLDSSIKITAMIGMGLIATPMAKVMLSPIA